MAYVDYSTNFVLDQFFTYLNANQFGANDEHLYNSFAVEHNINTATVDGTHKANSITGSIINTTPVSTGSATGTWLPAVGVYQIVYSALASSDSCYIELYISGAWRSGHNPVSGNGDVSADGILFFDGSNMRVVSGGGTIYYQKF